MTNAWDGAFDDRKVGGTPRAKINARAVGDGAFDVPLDRFIENFKEKYRYA